MNRLYRSRTDRKISGLCGGLGQRYGIDPTIIRLVFVATAFFSGGVAIPLYILAVLVIPMEPWNGPFGPDYPGGYGHSDGENRGPYSSWREWKHAEKWQRRAQRHGYGFGCGQGSRPDPGYEQAASQNGSDLDDLMKDIEKKAMHKEIEELRAKVAQYEQQHKTKGEI